MLKNNNKMQEIRLLFIFLATMILSSLLLFIYFKTRIIKVEEKMEIMFTLIQNHVEDRQPRQFIPEPQVQLNKRVNLIDVSDNDESDESEDDSDEDDDLVIDDSTIKKISLNLDNTDVLFNNKENINNLEISQDIFIQKSDGGYEEDSDDCEEAVEDAVEDSVEDSVEDTVEMTVEDTVEMTVGDAIEDAVEEAVEESVGSAVEDVITVDLNKLKVSELRKMCSDKNKTGYKSLKKQQLINLLGN